MSPLSQLLVNPSGGLYKITNNSNNLVGPIGYRWEKCWIRENANEEVFCISSHGGGSVSYFTFLEEKSKLHLENTLIKKCQITFFNVLDES